MDFAEYAAPIKDMNSGRLSLAIIDVLRNYRLELSPDLVIMIKALVTAECALPHADSLAHFFDSTLINKSKRRTQMYKKILVPLDGSKLAECALRHAESLAHAYDSTLFLLSVISPADIAGRTPAEMEAFQDLLDKLRDETKNYLSGLAGVFTEKNIKTEIHIGIEPVVRQIIETAEEHDVDLVLIASHGRSGLERVFFGSVASGVLNRIERPLMVIHPSS